MKPSVKLLHWLPRLISILAILFVSLFAVDVFNSEQSRWKQLEDFFIHLIPSFILLSILLLAWKYEFTGGIIFTLIGLVMSPVIFEHNYNMNHSIGESLGIIMAINLPFVIVGVLFIISHYLKKNNNYS